LSRFTARTGDSGDAAIAGPILSEVRHG